MKGGGEAFASYLQELRPEVERELGRLLPDADAASLAPTRLRAAMRYAVFAGGKRVRPTLVVAAGEICGAPRARLLAGAGAVELIHTYSLIHDDLPALDDDALRRGRPTVHRAFDEATAILAGDALLTLGLTTLAAEPLEVPGERRAAAVALVGSAIGTGGMIGGQALDLEAEADWPAEPGATLDRIHLGKTAALIAASLRLGGLYAGAGDGVDSALERLGRGLGLLFQIADDLLDVVGTTDQLGKTAGKDARATKLTYPALYGPDATRTRLALLADQLRLEIAALPGDGKLMNSLLAFLSARTS
jgi:geranylgeranyl pyrophosphate synthase